MELHTILMSKNIIAKRSSANLCEGNITIITDAVTGSRNIKYLNLCSWFLLVSSRATKIVCVQDIFTSLKNVRNSFHSLYIILVFKQLSLYFSPSASNVLVSSGNNSINLARIRIWSEFSRKWMNNKQIIRHQKYNTACPNTACFAQMVNLHEQGEQ